MQITGWDHCIITPIQVNFQDFPPSARFSGSPSANKELTSRSVIECGPILLSQHISLVWILINRVQTMVRVNPIITSLDWQIIPYYWQYHRRHTWAEQGQEPELVLGTIFSIFENDLLSEWQTSRSSDFMIAVLYDLKGIWEMSHQNIPKRVYMIYYRSYSGVCRSFNLSETFGFI